MAFNEQFATRVREIIVQKYPEAIEKKMFGGLAFMLKDRMFAGIVKDELMIRCIPERYSELLEHPHCKEMTLTGRPMKGFLYVEPEGLINHQECEFWLDIGYEFVEKSPVKKLKR